MRPEDVIIQDLLAGKNPIREHPELFDEVKHPKGE